MGQFDNKVVVITGATSGIGEATAKQFAEKGGNVVLLGRNLNKGQKIVSDIVSNGGKAVFMKCDVSDENSVREITEIIAIEFKKVDVLFNNAGIMLPSSEIENTEITDWKKTFEVNLDGVFYVTRNLKKLIYTCKGCIINNASIAGMHSYVTGRSYAYSASKSAVIQFTRQMAKNYAPDGIRVNCVCPGIIDTPILGDRDRKVYAERIPLGYVGSPEDVANVVVFLASKKASYLTGVVLPVDGGYSLNSPQTIYQVLDSKILDRFSNLKCWAKIQKSKILVTGATGFVGCYVASILVRMNDILGLNNEIIIHGRSLSKLINLYGKVLLRDDVRLYISDISCEQVFVKNNIDYIVHTAMPSDSLQSLNPVSILNIAIKGTENIVDLSLLYQTKSLVYLSSVTIYGNTAGKMNIKEDYYEKQDWRNDNDAYMLGKRAAEFILLSSHRNHQLPVKILRPGYVYGANPTKDCRVYNSFISDVANNKKIELKSDGLLKRPLVYILDLVKAIFLALESNENGESFNVSGSDMSLREYYNCCIDGNVETQEPSTNNTIDIEKSKSSINWSVDFSHEENIQEAINIKRKLC